MLDEVLHIDDLKSGKIGRKGLDRSEREELKTVLSKFLGNPYAREFIYNHLREMGYMQITVFDQSPTVSAYLEGRRSAATRFVQILKEVAPDYVFMMLREGESYGS